MDIYNQLIKDHKKIKNLFSQAGTADINQRQELFGIIKSELILHTIAEQSTFYKALAKYNESYERAIEGIEEHKSITQFLEKLDSMPIHSQNWLMLFNQLKIFVDKHVQEEETEVFAIAKKVLTKHQAEQIGLIMEEKKNQLMEIV